MDKIIALNQKEIGTVSGGNYNNSIDHFIEFNRKHPMTLIAIASCFAVTTAVFTGLAMGITMLIFIAVTYYK